MKTLNKIHSGAEVNLYQVSGSQNPNVYIASTPLVGAICTRAEMVTPEFEDSLHQGISSIIAKSPLGKKIIESIGETKNVDFLNILRGGSNFDPTLGLYRIGLRTSKHYVSSQRELQDNRTWRIVQKGYEKLFYEERGPREINLFFGDIVATGTSLKDGLYRTLDAVRQGQHTLRSLYFFTIGGAKAEEIISEVIHDDNYRDVLAEVQAHVIYLEGIFGLASDETPLRIKNPDTDLLTYHEGAIITPEFAAVLMQTPEFLLEPCIIYDGGKRANSWPAHLGEVIEYWKKLQEEATNGLTLQEAIMERFPPITNVSLEDWRKSYPWRGLDQEVEQLIMLGKNLRSSEDNLVDLCHERIESCEKMLIK